MNATAAARTYRITGLQPYVMLLVLAAATAFAPFVLGHAVSTRSWFELVWVAVVVWFWCSTIWRAAYRIDVTADTVEFRSILWRRTIPVGRLRSIRARGSGFALVRFRGGRVDLYGNVDGWDEFVAGVRAANRHVRVIGPPADQARHAGTSRLRERAGSRSPSQPAGRACGRCCECGPRPSSA